ncbi:MAG TPA: peptide ABC transporter substrate-binding protein [Rubrobacteraceae bacterium]|nr:peptide ABC transporter substrate-binding protein [Rubrobacteraceae bacterium]
MKTVLRRLALVAFAALIGLIAGGCSSDDEPGQDGSTGKKTVSSEHLVVGYDQEPAILNQFIVGGESVATSDVVAGILEKPYEIQPDLSLAPELAEGKPKVLSKDPLRIEYRLKEDLTFSDGEPLTSLDARFTYNAIMDPDNNVITREGWDKIESFETPDEYTVRMTFSEPYAAWQDLVSGPQSAILPRHIYRSEDFNRALNSEIVGSGPYTLREWNKGRDLILEENPNYWGEAPEIQQFTIRFILDAGELDAALQSGEVSFINPPLKPGLGEKLESYQGVQVRSAAGTFWEHIAFNTNKVDNLKLRRAIAYGINREQLLDEILPGKVEPLDSVLVPQQNTFYTPAWEKYGFDPERSRELVREARSEGADTTISFTTAANDELRGKLQKEIQRQLENVGVTVEIDNADSSTLFGERLPEGRFQMGEWAWLATPEPQLTWLFGADAIPPDGQNYYRYENPEASFLMSRADKTINISERARLIKQVQRIIADDLPVIPLYQRPVYYAYDEDLEGPKINPTLAGPFWNIGEWSVREE